MLKKKKIATLRQMMEENNVIEDNIETDSEKIKRLEAQVFQLKNIILKLVNIARIFHDYLVKLM